MQPKCREFKAHADQALADGRLQAVMRRMGGGFAARRAAAVARLPEFDALRDQGRALKDHVLAHLDHYLEAFEAQVVAGGGQVHWCSTAEEARSTILELCRAVGARTVVKSKSMIAEEIGLGGFMEDAGLPVIETDLGEYIIQLRREPPSHLIAPAAHLGREDVAQTFRAAHPHLDPERILDAPPALVAEARQVLRQKFLDADVGITGANFLIAETGSTVIVTNEGNGDLGQCLPRTHIVLASLEKVVPTLEDAALMLRLLARSATGQEFSAYATLSTGPRRAGDLDGPQQFHVVLLDNGRADLLGGELQDVLRCIRCGACINHCPVYGAVGGHAYGWVYPGPIGAALTPALIGVHDGAALADASTFCGRCESVCPMRIPLPRLMRQWRERAFAAREVAWTTRWALRAWAWLALRPRLYGLATALAMRSLGWLGRGRGRFRTLPGGQAWTRGRDFPAPQGPTFRALWRERRNAAPDRRMER